MRLENREQRAAGSGQRSVVIVMRGFASGAPHSAFPIPHGAFTLIEVLIAIGMFFIVSFAVLELMVVGLGAAHALQIRHADVGMLAAEFVGTNQAVLEEEVVESGDFGDFYPGARWERTATEVGSNGLWQIDFTVVETVGKKEVWSQTSILYYDPKSKGKFSQRPGSFGTKPMGTP